MQYDLKNIKELAGGDKEFISIVISAFLEETLESMGLLGEAIEHKDFEWTYKHAHKLKPNFELFGMEKEHATVLRIEKIGKDKESLVEAKALFRVLERDVSSVMDELKRTHP